MNVVLAVLLLAVPALALAALALPVRSGAGAASRESGRVLAARLAGLTLGVAAAVAAGHAWSLGRGAMLGPVLLGTGLLLGIAAGETLARPARVAGPRTADLTPRKVRSYAPRGQGAAVVAVLVLMVAVLVVTTATASADDLGRPGRSLTRTCGMGVSSSRSPYPGSFYSGPLALGLVVALGLGAVAARQAVLRPRGLGAEEDALRAQSVRAVVAGAGVVVCATFIGVAVVTASVWDQICSAGVLGLLAGPLRLAAGLALGVLAWCLASLVRPARRTASRPRVDAAR